MAKNPSRQRNSARGMTAVSMLFFFAGFLLLALKRWEWQCFLLAAVVPALIFAGNEILPHLFPSDRLLLCLTNFLCALGVLILYRISPERGLTQALNYGVGVGGMVLSAQLVRHVRSWKLLTLLMMAGEYKMYL